MMELYKNRAHFVYLFFLTILVYLGAFFSVPIVAAQKLPAFFIWTPTILYINTLLLHWILSHQDLEKKAVFMLCALYLVSPLHMDTLEFTALVQLCLAETVLILSLIFYLKDMINYSLVSIVVASFLNFKSIGFIPLILISPKFSLKHKLIYVLNVFVVIIYSFSEFLNEIIFIKDNLITLIFSFENLLNPLRFSFLNSAVLVFDYYPNWLMALFIVLVLAIAIYSWIKKSTYGVAISCTIFGMLISLVIPVKYYLESGLSHYLFMPSTYPFVMVLFLFSLTLILRKYSSVIILISLAIVGVMWASTTMSIQASNRDIVVSWDVAVEQLPKKYNYIEKVKFNYVQVLMNNGFNKEAEAIIVDAKKEYLKKEWFHLHLALASFRKDENLIKEIHEELKALAIQTKNKASN